MRRLIMGLGIIVAVAGCTTNETYTRTDEDRKFVDLYSTTDRRTAMATANEDPAVKAAVVNLKEEVQQRPSDVNSWLNLAKLQVAQGRLNDADGSARKALRLDMKNTEARKVLAQVAMKRAKFEMAEILLNSIGGNRSSDSEVINMMALLALNKQEPAFALDLFKKAIKLDSSNISARMNLGVLYLKYRQLHAAAIQFERVLRVMPENTDAMLHLAVIKGTRGDRQKAEEMLETVLDRKGNNPLALFNLAVLQSQGKDYESALENLRAYLRSARGRSQDTDQAFALIERIKEQQKLEGGDEVSDEEIDALAADLEQRENAPKQHAMNHSEADKGAIRPVSEDEAEIDALEKALIE